MANAEDYKSQDLINRLQTIKHVLGRDLKIAHVTPLKRSLDILLLNRLELLKSYGIQNSGLSSNEDRLKEANQTDVFHFIPANHLTRRMSPLSDFRAFIEFYHIFKKNNFDIVATYGPKPGIFARIAARLAGVPVVVHTSWGLLFTESSSYLRKSCVLAMETVASQFGDRVISVNSDDISYLEILEKIKLGKKHSPVINIGNACNLDYFDPKKVAEDEIVDRRCKWGVNPDAIVVGMIGRLVEEKGCLEFIYAAEKIKKKYPNCEFIMLGRQDRNKHDAIDIEMARQHVIFPGFESNMRVAYAAMDIVVLPSFREGFPRSLVEACAMGKPIVTTNTRGCREAVLNGENGLLVPPGDGDSLANSIQTIIANSDFRRHAEQCSREKALCEFDDRKLVKKVLRVYLEAIEDNLLKVGHFTKT